MVGNGVQHLPAGAQRMATRTSTGAAVTSAKSFNDVAWSAPDVERLVVRSRNLYGTRDQGRAVANV